MLLALPALAITAALLAGCAPAAHAPETAGPSHSATPSAEPTDEAAVDTDDTDDDADTDAGPAFDVRANIVDAVSSGNTAALHDLFAPTVYVSYCASEMFGDVSDHDLLVSDVSEATSPTAAWNFALSTGTLDGYRASGGGSYVADFPSGAIVGASSEDKVISFVLTGDLITRLFICNYEPALHE